MKEELQGETSINDSAARGTSHVERVDGPVTLNLLDSSLWQAFREEGTEMIITKAGRRMFPIVMVTVRGLSPTLLYSIHLSLVPCDGRQYKFCQRRWVSVSDTVPAPTNVPDQLYAHPASPNRGSFWCQEMISFAKLKITNNKHSQGDIVLQSMRKYMAQIIIREDLGDVEYVFPLPETTFVAVTQYQNEAVTRMKIAHNPFANGFKYAHVTGSDDGKKIFARSDGPRPKDCKQEKNSISSSSSGKSSAKTARVKATITPRPLTPNLPYHYHSNINLHHHPSSYYQPPSDDGSRQEPLLSPTYLSRANPSIPAHHLASSMPLQPDMGLALQQLSSLSGGGYPVTSSASTSVSPYAFDSDEADQETGDAESELSVDVGMEEGVEKGEKTSGEEQLSASAGGEIKVTDTKGPKLTTRKAEEEGSERDGKVEAEEDCAAADASSASGDVPTVVRSADEDAANESSYSSSFRGDMGLGDQQPASGSFPSSSIPTNSSTTAFLATIQSSTQGGPENMTKSKTDTFKHPLPKKSSFSSSNKNPHAKRYSPAHAASGARYDMDLQWYRNALRQASQKRDECVVKQDRGVQLKLLDQHIWHSFANCGSKMVISHQGRNMFPIINVTLRGLDPGRLYSVWLHVTGAEDVTSSQFQEQGMPGTTGLPLQRTVPPIRPYMHPCSPMRGLAWMKVKVKFDGVKLTSNLASEDASCLPLLPGKRYLTQVVVREEEELTPGNSGSSGDLLFFPLSEVTFNTHMDVDDVNLACPSATNGDSHPDISRKRTLQPGSHNLGDEMEVRKASKYTRSDVTLPPRNMASAGQPGAGHLSSDLSPPPGPHPHDSTALVSRPSELTNRLNPIYCFPPVSSLQPAHVGLLANRMPVPSPLQTLASFPFQTPLFPQLRTPMHSAFGMTLPPFNPLPYLYYPYALPSVGPLSVPPDAQKGLDLSMKSTEHR